MFVTRGAHMKILEHLSWLKSKCITYSRLQIEVGPTFIDFWFFPGCYALLKREKVLFWIYKYIRAPSLILFAKFSKPYVYFLAYVYSRV